MSEPIQSPAAKEPATVGNSASGALARVLVVDDQRLVTEHLGELLSSHNYDVVGVTNGEDAVAHVCRSTTDIVLLDVHMPGLDGVGACKLMKQHDAQLPIIFITGIDDPGILEQGADAYIAKPIDEKMLLVMLQHLLDKRRATERAAAPPA